LPVQLELFAAYMASPGFRPEAVSQTRRDLASFYQSLDHELSGPLLRDAARVMTDQDPRFGLPALSDVLARSGEEARAWLRRALREGPPEIVIVGDVDIETAVGAVARTLGTVQLSQQGSPTTRAPNLPGMPAPVKKQYRVRSGVARAMLDIRWLAKHGTAADDSVELEVLGVVFSERVRKRLRDDLGVAYAPAARAVPMPALSRTELQVSANTAPEKLTAAVAAVLEEAASLATHGVKSDEVDAAKKLMKSQAHRSDLDNGAWALRLIVGADTLDARVDAHRRRLALIESIDRARVARAARKLLDPASSYQFTVVPEPVQPLDSSLDGRGGRQ
jgi:zinc protease